MIKQVIIGATRTITKCFKKNLEAIPEKKFIRFTTKDSYTWKVIHIMGSTAV